MFLRKKLGKLKKLNLIGGSLLPFLKEGDEIYVDVSDKDVGNFELVSFLKGKDVITHISKKIEGKLFFISPGGRYFDGPIKGYEILGKVHYVKKGPFLLPSELFKIFFWIYFKILK